jgi:hypothetical protein
MISAITSDKQHTTSVCLRSRLALLRQHAAVPILSTFNADFAKLARLHGPSQRLHLHRFIEYSPAPRVCGAELFL